MAAAYTHEQIAAYLTHVGFPSPSPFPEPTLANLKRLVRHHLAAVPFESLWLHYSTARTLSVDPEDLFRKIVRPPPPASGDGDVGDRRGGYCMEVNALFGAVLRGLGYDVMSVGGRVSNQTMGKPGEGYSGWHVSRKPSSASDVT
ncbi:hypothetical protein jhhlp_007026 [Lomentospora prolificans]|uniref:Uncharacterized protein n=1 Tax=Lomentospora prolificans TaxID=41688 RepID=A0A2N3N1G6_9PEZI|nr:hypothetical protein jhhlp_007026 [Lomentospora prolificans]